jgi:bifunctional UDP-N-acetylglucosamine pyrophosphorylase/glucosamine-1-phosphate N-acetyltransferase
MAIRDAVVMCAGNGFGLWPITETVAKPMVKLLGKSLLFRILEGLKAAGVRNAHFVTGHLEGKVIAEARVDCERLGISPFFIHQKSRLGTADAVKSAEGSITGPFIVASGDHVLDMGIYKDAVNAFSGESLVVLKKVKNPYAYGVAEVESGVITGMIEKPRQPKTDLANVGIYIFNENIFNELRGVKLSVRNEYEITDVLKGKKAFVTGKYWLDVGMPWMLIEAMDFLFSIEKPRMDGEMRKTEAGGGKVIMEEGAVVEESVIEGNLYIGKNARIGPFSTLRGNVCIGNNTTILENCAITGTLTGRSNSIGAGCIISDSVIGNNAEIGASAKFASQKLDKSSVTIETRKGPKTAPGNFGAVVGDNAKIGMNSSVLPGRLIGTGAWMAPNSVANRNINVNEMFGFVKQQ